MKKLHKILALTLALVMMLVIMAVPAMAADSNFEIWEHDDNTMLVKYSGSGSDVVIPDGVNAILNGAFDGCSGLKSVTIPVSIYIEMNAFNNCPDLKSITFSASVVHITSGAFNNCPNLTDIYFSGTQEQWAALERDALKEFDMPIFVEGVNPTVHYNSTGPDAPTTPATPTTPTAPAAPKVQLSSQPLTVDGKAVNAQAYNIGGSNFFKLRDVAMMLGGTGKQFSVGYDNATRTVTATSGEAYTAIGGELAAGADMSASCVVSDQPIIVNGETLNVTVYNIGGSNYFMLRDLGEALGFGVDYDAATRTVLVSTK